MFDTIELTREQIEERVIGARRDDFIQKLNRFEMLFSQWRRGALSDKAFSFELGEWFAKMKEEIQIIEKAPSL